MLRKIPKPIIKRKTLLSGALCSLLVLLVSFDKSPDGADPTQTTANVADFAQHPPHIDRVWVQKMAQTAQDGSNMTLYVRFDNPQVLPEDLTVYAAGQDISFHHITNIPSTILDGSTTSDRYQMFVATVRENIPAFLAEIASNQTTIRRNGGSVSYNGHLGSFDATVPEFNKPGFDRGQIVELIRRLTANTAVSCTNATAQSSYFITDLSVIEDHDRTYQVQPGTAPGIGTPMGAYTFGRIIQNATNNGAFVSPKEFLKHWVRQWIEPQTVNGQTINPRFNAMATMIQPWISKASGLTINDASVGDWEGKWDACTEQALLTEAPFRLMAIVNRLDLRGNTSYARSLSNAGETRLIYTLIDFNTGEPPTQLFNNFPQTHFVDWKGFNVIFEFGNVQNNVCNLQAFGTQWINLGNQAINTGAYRTALEAIVNTVTAANAAPGRPNGSALNRIRTNERLFDDPTGGDEPGWGTENWQLRQFEINANSHHLEGAALTNTPVLASNHPVVPEHTDLEISEYDPNFDIACTMDPALATKLLYWVYDPANFLQARFGNHSMPDKFPNTNIPFLAAEGTLSGEYAHFTEFNWDSPQDPNTVNGYPGIQHYRNNPNDPTAGYIVDNDAREVRRQVSVSTCQGCHGGETKTLFTHMLPLGYGKTAEYWKTNPVDVEVGVFDARHQSNTGVNSNNGNAPYYPKPWSLYRAMFIAGQQNVDPNNPIKNSFTKLSPFLTGMYFREKIADPANNHMNPAPFQDDLSTAADDASDNTLTGMYYVNDPTNLKQSLYNAKNIPETSQTPNVAGYNDLNRRMVDLCNFVNQDCSGTIRFPFNGTFPGGVGTFPGGVVVNPGQQGPFPEIVGNATSKVNQIIASMGFIPFAIGSH